MRIRPAARVDTYESTVNVMISFVKTKLFLGLAVAATLAAMAFSQVGAEKDEAEKQQGAAVGFQPPLGLYTVRRAAIGGMAAVGGTVQPLDTVKLSAQIPGRVLFIAGDVGSRHKKGEVLVRIDTEELEAKLREAMAAEASANAQIRAAWAQYQRELASPSKNRTMGGFGFPAMFDDVFTEPIESFMGTRHPGVERGVDVYSRQIQIEQAQHALAQAQARIRQIQSKLRDAESIAPFDGAIAAKYVEVGDTVQPGQPLIDYTDPSRLEVVADVPVGLRPALREGARIQVRIGGRTVPGVVRRIAPVADPVRHTVHVKVALPEGVQAEAGQYAELLIPDPRAQGVPALIIPQSAVVEKGGLHYVFVVDDKNRAVLRLVRLGEPHGQGMVTVLAGLAEGTKIVKSPPPGLKSGQQI